MLKRGEAQTVPPSGRSHGRAKGGYAWRLDGICMSQVIHGLPDEVRSACLAESARILVPGGFFALLDWSKPGFGYTAAVWGWSLLGLRKSRNWLGTYAEVFARFGLELASDVYLDSLNRCQRFIKPARTERVDICDRQGEYAGERPLDGRLQ